MFLAAAALFAAGLSQAGAAEVKPIAAVAVASYNDLIDDVNFVGGLVDRPALGAGLDGLVTLVTQGKGLTGVDKARPFGAIVQASDESDIAGYVFLPINDFKAALELLKLYNTVDDQGGVYKLTPKDGKQVVYVKQHHAWACFSDKAESLAHIAGDPLAAVRGMEKTYIVGARVFLNNVPETLRDKVLAGLKSGIENEANTKKGDENDEQFALRKKFMEQTEAYLVRTISDLEQIDLGWGLDRKVAKTYFDVSLTAKPGSEAAKEIALAAETKTNFAGFRIPGAAALYAVAGPIPESKQQIAQGLIELVRSHAMAHIAKEAPENKREAAKEVFGGGLDLLTKIVKSGRVDVAMTGLLGENSATGLGAFYIADGKLLDKIVHTAVKAIEEEHPELTQFVKLDARTSNGLNIHTISIPIPENAENREKVVKYIGENFEAVVAIGDDEMYVALGRDHVATVKKAVAASREAGAKSVEPIKFSYAAQPIAGAIAAIGKPEEQTVAKMAVAELKKSPHNDHVNFTVRPVDNGVRMRLEVEPGLLRLAGRIVVMRMEGKAPTTSTEASEK
jgi:hypothetical protein